MWFQRNARSRCGDRSGPRAARASLIVACAVGSACGRLAFEETTSVVVDAAAVPSASQQRGDASHPPAGVAPEPGAANPPPVAASDAGESDQSATAPNATAPVGSADASTTPEPVDAGVAAGDGVMNGDATNSPAPDAALGPGLVALACGDYHTCSIDAAGAMWCWGSNSAGQLGVGDTQSRTQPTPVESSDRWRIVRAGDLFTCGADGGGLVRCFGANDRAQLGNGTTDPTTGLGEVLNPDLPLVRLNAGATHTCGLSGDGKLWCWGSNLEGQLTNEPVPTESLALVPTAISSDRTFSAIGAGQGHTCAIRSDATLWCTGRNTSRELGAGDSLPEQQRTWVQAGTFADWTAVDATQHATCAMRRGASLWCWGEAGYGSLGIAYSSSPVGTPTVVEGGLAWAAFDTNAFHTCGVDARGALYCWGRNAEGQLGLGHTSDTRLPTRVGTETHWTDVATGRFHTCARTSDDRVACMGANDEGQLGVGDAARRNVPTFVNF